MMLKRLFRIPIEINLYSFDTALSYGTATLLINENGCDVKVNGFRSEQSFKQMVGVLKNNHIVILLNGFLLNGISASYKSETTIRFTEVLYSDKSEFNDNTLKVSLEIQPFAIWFNRAFYDLDLSGESHINFAIQKEKIKSFVLPWGKILLCYEANCKLNNQIIIRPLTKIVLEFPDKVEKSIAYEKLVKVISFFQLFLFSKIQGNTLIFNNGDSNLESHSNLFQAINSINEEEKIQIIISFNSIEGFLQSALEIFFKHDNLFYFISQMHQDAIENKYPVNRFLSAFRIFECIGKHFESIASDSIKERAKNLTKEIKSKFNRKKFSGSWIFLNFLQYESLLEIPPFDFFIKISDFRNALSHGDHIQSWEINYIDINRLTTSLCGYNMALLYKMLGLSDELCTHVNHYYNSMVFSDSYEISEFSMISNKILIKK